MFRVLFAGKSSAMENPPAGYTRVCPYLLYEDAASAVEYLTNAFGFVQRLTQTGAAGRTHTELVLVTTD